MDASTTALSAPEADAGVRGMVKGIVCTALALQGFGSGIGLAAGVMLDTAGIATGATQATPSVGELLSHNLAAAMPSYLGAITFGLASVWGCLGQGFMVGTLIGAALRTRPLGAVLVAIVPHGIFELAGFSLAAASGLLVPVLIVRSVFLGVPVRRSGVVAYAWLACGSVALIALAAIVESRLTPLFMSAFGLR